MMKSKKKTDLPDSPKDKKHLSREEFEIEMPDASDIPGQEHIQVPPGGEMADTTASSDDEEGVGVLDNPRDEEVITDPGTDVSEEEIKALDDAMLKTNTRDQENLDASRLEQYDEDGEPLNEKTDLSGNDLDVPGSELDDDDEEVGEEDEENNPYSVDEENEDNDINTRQ